MFTIKISSWPEAIVSQKNETILDTALRAGVPYPHNCRSGECGECKTKLLSGDVVHDPYCKSELSDIEREQGYVLACRSRPTCDVEVACNNAIKDEINLPVKRYKSSVSSITQVAHNVTCLRLLTTGKIMRYMAGQYADLSVGKLPARSFSMANKPGDRELEFHIRHFPDGLVSGYISSSLRVGEKVWLEGPFGGSYLRSDFAGPMILAAGGTGLAPILSILKEALQHNQKRSIHVYFGVQQELDIYYEHELQQLAEHYPNVIVHIVLSGELAETKRRQSFVHEAVDSDFQDLSAAKVYAAGPPPMIDALRDVVIAKGVSEDNIHSDPFTPAVNNDVSVQKGNYGGFISRLFG